MTAATTTKEFTEWLKKKLKELNTDESIFASYIIGILEGEDTHQDKFDALEGILCEIIDVEGTNIGELISVILNKWLECHPKHDEHPKKGLTLDVNEQLAKLLEAQKLQPTVNHREYTDEERRIRDHILAQYSQTEVSDEDDPDAGEEKPSEKPSTASSSMSGIERNTNVHDVLQLQKERRDQARMDSAAKKQKDKEDREKQRQLREEKKEKRKTVKNEKRR